jgi:hypothetical protein
LFGQTAADRALSPRDTRINPPRPACRWRGRGRGRERRWRWRGGLEDAGLPCPFVHLSCVRYRGSRRGATRVTIRRLIRSRGPLNQRYDKCGFTGVFGLIRVHLTNLPRPDQREHQRELRLRIAERMRERERERERKRRLVQVKV